MKDKSSLSSKRMSTKETTLTLAAESKPLKAMAG